MQIEVTRAGLVFDVRVEGPQDGPVVVLLHGFPQSAACWAELVPLLTAAGLRTVAPDQRGYSPGARPRRRRDYAIGELVADVTAVADAVSPDRPVHVVGHDWGGGVAWAFAARHPGRTATLTALSSPPPQALLRSLRVPAQARASWYLAAFQLPWWPERMLLPRAGERVSSRFVRMLVASGQRQDRAVRDAARLSRREALAGAVAWYRGLPFAPPRPDPPVTRPSLLVWGDRDTGITRAAVRDAARFVAGPFRFVELPGVSHWVPEEVAGLVAPDLIAHMAGDSPHTSR